MLIGLAWLTLSTVEAQTINYVLGTVSLFVGPASGSNSVVLGVTPATGAWTATNNATWLHLGTNFQSGTGSTNVVFSYDANPGPTRTGTLTIADQTLTVTQAGESYVAATLFTNLVSTGLSHPEGIAVDGAGNVYIADTSNGMVKEFSASNNTVTTLVSSGLSAPQGVAVDNAGNVYIADTGNDMVKERRIADGSVITLVSNGLGSAESVAVDSAGNVYIDDSADGNIRKWSPVNSNLTAIASGFQTSQGVGLDAADNVYVLALNGGGLNGTAVFDKWSAPNTRIAVALDLVSVNISGGSVAVDGSGNVYTAFIGTTISEPYFEVGVWNLVSNTLYTAQLAGLDYPSNAPLFGLNYPYGVAADGRESLYIADTGNNCIKEYPHAFVDPTAKLEGLAAGTDALPLVLPDSVFLQGQFAPATDQPWLTITGITNGVVSFSFTAATASRTANINLLGISIPVTQGEPGFALGTPALVEPPGAGSDSVILATVSGDYPWTATSNATWLHLSPTNQSGNTSTNIVFNYDANPGSTRVGTLTIADETLTVTQAGTNYVPANTVVTLATLQSAGLVDPNEIAVDGNGNVFVADYQKNEVKEWSPGTDAVRTVIASGLDGPEGMALDSAGNIYIAEYWDNCILEWTATHKILTTVISNIAFSPQGVAVDTGGNVYFASANRQILYELPAANTNWTAVAPLSHNEVIADNIDLAADRAGNIYIGFNPVLRWSPENQSLTNWSALLPSPWNIAVDGGGNVYTVYYPNNNSIYKWSAASNTATACVSSGLDLPIGLAVDASENVYITDTEGIKEFPHAFLDTNAVSEGAAAGNDSLSAVLPVTENLLPPFAPTSDQSWLTITGITNGVVSFSFTANTGSNRRANIILLGQNIPITQEATGASLPNFTGFQMLNGGVLQFGVTNVSSASLTVLTTTNLSLPLINWTVVGTATNMAPGQFQFTTQPGASDSQRFYTIRSQ
jgi:sugar lactone lactonase YvrE